MIVMMMMMVESTWLLKSWLINCEHFLLLFGSANSIKSEHLLAIVIDCLLFEDLRTTGARIIDEGLESKMMEWPDGFAYLLVTKDDIDPRQIWKIEEIFTSSERQQLWIFSRVTSPRLK